MTAAPVRNTSYITPFGDRVLQHEVIVPAGIEDVWKAFTTSEGLRKFIAPVVALDFRAGGIWESSYNPEAKIGDPGNIQNEIVCYLPMEMLTIRIHRTPPGFPHPEVAKAVWTVIQFTEVGDGQVRIRTSMIGWQAGPEWDKIYQFFEWGNAETSAKAWEYFDGKAGK